MVDIGRDFVAPSYPAYEPDRSSNESSGSHNGTKLFDHASSFYSWYLQRINTDMDYHQPTRETLAKIMNIAKVSADHGNFLSKTEEDSSVLAIKNLTDDLNIGAKKQYNIPEVLINSLDSIVSQNPKAKLVAKITELEYKTCLRDPTQLSDEDQASLKDLFTEISNRISSDTPSLNAEAISRSIDKLLDESPPPNTMIQELQDNIKSWL